MENFSLAVSRFKRNRFDECIKLCDEMLKLNENDFAVQILRTHALRKKNQVDDLEIDEEGLGDKLLDEHKILSNAKPGTSLDRNKTQGNQAIKPMSSSGRPISGVARPNSRAVNRGESRSGTIINNNQQINRGVTSGGRNIRMATATLQSLNSGFTLDTSKMNIESLVKKKSLAKVNFYFRL